MTKYFGITITAIFIALLLVIAAPVALWAQQAIVEVYYIPLPEQDLFGAFTTINSASRSPVQTTVSIAIGGKTVIYYDQWENGYEPVINVPTNIFSSGAVGCPAANPAGTQIWGNNNPCDGTAPGFASDSLDSGDVIILNNAVAVPRNPGQVRFDGGDKIGSTYPIAVTRTGYPSTPGTLLAGGTDVLKTSQWGTTYRAPLGQDVASTTNAWEYARVFVMAGSNGTLVSVNGVAQPTTLNEGQNMVIAVKVNDLITTNKPAQITLVTGDIGSTYEMRWYSMVPVGSWHNEYYMPVGTRSNFNPPRAVAVWLYNPDQSSTLRVDWQIGSTTGFTNVPAKKAVMVTPFIGGSDGRDGARFFTTNGAPFYALSQSDAADSGQLYEWGFSLVPSRLLSAQALVGYGIGCTQPGANLSGSTCPLGNTNNARNFVWVMPTTGSNVPIYVAYDGRSPVCPATSGDYDLTFTLNALRIQTLQQPQDLDMTGSRIWTCAAGVNLVVAWGQDPARSGSGDNQALDMGTVVFPLSSIQVQKGAAFAHDADGDNAISPGDTLTYTIAIVNNAGVAANFTVSDVLPAGVTYVPNSTIYQRSSGTTPVPDNTSPETAFPLDEGGLSQIGSSPLRIERGEVQTIAYRLTINPSTDCTLTLVNTAEVNAGFPNGNVGGVADNITVLTCNPGIRIKKLTNNVDADSPTGPFISTGSPVTWTYVVTNTGDVDLTNVKLIDDKLGAITNGSGCTIPSTFAKGSSFTCTKTGIAAEGQYANVATVTANSVVSATQKVTDTDPSHYFGQSPAIKITKYTSSNGGLGRADANVPIGPIFNVGDPVLWTYVVINTGNVTLTNVQVTDDQVGPISCPKNVLAPQESMTCTKTGTAQAGQYTNIASVEGTPPAGPPVTDDDPSHYFGAQPALKITKYTNGEDANTLPGVALDAGDLIMWTYVVTNTGNVPLAIVVVDDQLGPVACTRNITPPGGVFLCFALGVAEVGQYTNIATATATYNNVTVTDSDPSNYTAIAPPPPDAPSILVKKLTNGVLADNPPGPLIQVGDPVTWTYFVLNNGNVALDVTLTDDRLAPGAISCPQPALDPAESMLCHAFGTAEAGQYANTATVTGTLDGPPITDTDPSHYFGLPATIQITKFTNGEDANSIPGPHITEGDPVIWTYVVTNTGQLTLTNVTVTDNQGVFVSCPQLTLSPGGSMTCQGDPGVAQLGQYANTGTVTGTAPNGETVVDTDPSHYFGDPPFIEQGAAITIKKYTEGEDADTPTGPLIAVGSPVHWTYVVTNTGSVVLNNVNVTDNRGVIVSCPKTTLASAEAMTCTSSGIAVSGQYSNTGTATGTPPVGAAVTSSDLSHYFGGQASMVLTKYTNDEDANTVTGPLLVSGAEVVWTYVLSNTGNVPLQSFTVEDSLLGPAGCPRIGLINPGQAVTCRRDGIATPGQYANNSTATATSILNQRLTDEDPSHYFGVDAGIEIKKYTNGDDADTPPGPQIDIGSPVTWTYIVTNTSNVPLTDIAVKDDQLGVVTCPATSLAAGASMTCTMIGVAVEGPYTNTANVFAVPPAGAEVVDEDPSHYTGSTPTGLPTDEQPGRTNDRDLFLPFVNRKDDGQ